ASFQPSLSVRACACEVLDSCKPPRRRARKSAPANTLEGEANCDHRSVQDGSLIPRYGRARRDPALAVLEGFHPLKHALRFGANVLEAVCADRGELERLSALLAPDLSARFGALAREVDPAVFARLAPLAPSTAVMGLAERARVDPAALLAEER